MTFSTQTQHRILFWLHLVQFPLTIAVLIIGLVRMFNKSTPRTQTNRWVISVSAKSLVIMSYMVLTEYVSAMKRFASTKANMMLSILESVFWVAAAVMPIMKIGSCTPGAGCTFTGVLIGLAIVLFIMSLPVTYICFCQRQLFKQIGLATGDLRPSTGEPKVEVEYGFDERHEHHRHHRS